MFRSINSLLL